jgi:hypothetical protein
MSVASCLLRASRLAAKDVRIHDLRHTFVAAGQGMPIIEKLLGHMRVQTTEIAAAEKINESYVGRVRRLTLLAPDIVEAILGGWQPVEMTLAVLMRPFPVGWRDQQ